MTEVWKDVVGYPGYRVSNLGRIMSLRRLKPCIRRTQIGSHGYEHALLIDDETGKKHYVSIHVAVAKAFHGERPDGFDCCHIDGNKRNNKAENLRWGSRKENYADQVRHGVVGNRGSKHGGAKLTEKQVVEIVKRLDAGERIGTLAKEFDIGRLSIGRINRGVDWGWLTGRTAETAASQHKRGHRVRGILTNEAVLDIVGRLDAGECQRGIADDHGVKPQTISEINLGKIWGWLTHRGKSEILGKDG